MLDANNPQGDIKTSSLKQELVRLRDHYAEFNDYSAFFCKAASLMISEKTLDLDKSIAQGAVRIVQDLIDTSQSIDDWLQMILKKL